MRELNQREQELVALGAAIASNCVPCIEFHVPEARRSGLGDDQIRQAIRIAEKVRRVPARLVLQTALARLEERPNGQEIQAEAGCGCAASSASGDPGCAG